MCTELWLENLKRGGHLDDLAADGSIILKKVRIMVWRRLE
jgi:hypothetical protein